MTCVLLFNFYNSLYILGIKVMSDIWLAKIFFSDFCRLSIFLIISFAMLNSYHSEEHACQFLGLFPVLLGSYSGNSWLFLCLEMFSLCFLLALSECQVFLT